MTVVEFMKLHQNDPKGYCPCVIDSQGDVFECPDGHLNALFDLDGGRNMLAEIPDNIAPLFYMIKKTKTVVVDYEAQVYSGKLTPEQQSALHSLSTHGYILDQPKNIHENIYL